MGFLDWLFAGRRRQPSVSLGLDDLMVLVPMWASRFREQPVSRALLRSRVADGCRLVGKAPLEAAVWERLTSSYDADALARLWIVNELARDATVQVHIPTLFPDTDAGPYVSTALCGTVEATGPLTMELLVESPLRIEEFVRHFLARLGAGVEGETVQAAQARLERLDYRNLLAEAERARESAEERMEVLRKLQEDLEARRMPRGKW